MLFRLLPFLRFSAFWAQKQILASKSCQNLPKREKSALFRLFAKMAPKIAKKKHFLEQGFWPMPFFRVLERKVRKSAFWGGKVPRNALFRTFSPKNAKIALLGENLKDP